MPRSEVQESCAGTSGVVEFPQGVQGDHGTPTRGSRSTWYPTEGLLGDLVPHRGARAIAELSRSGWGANTIGGQLPKEVADKRATGNSRD